MNEIDKKDEERVLSEPYSVQAIHDHGQEQNPSQIDKQLERKMGQKNHHSPIVEHGSSLAHEGDRETVSLATKHRRLTIRSHSGLSGDILFTGLAVLNLLQLDLAPDSEEARLWLSELCARIMPQLADCASLIREERFGIYGWSLDVRLPHAHEHRNLSDIRRIAQESKLSVDARNLGMAAFEILAHCEAEAHNKTIDEVHFHEVGALDSILDVFGVCELYCLLGQPPINASPLPVADGSVHCAHGILPAPAPAVLKLMRGLPVRPYEGALDSGELLTPTALSLVHSLRVSFGSWPAFTIEETALVYGKRVFPDGPNGIIFAIGEALP